MLQWYGEIQTHILKEVQINTAFLDLIWQYVSKALKMLTSFDLVTLLLVSFFLVFFSIKHIPAEKKKISEEG